MPELRTEITEVVTALGLSGRPTLVDALREPPASFTRLPVPTLDRLSAALSEGSYEATFDQAWENGVAFLGTRDGLRGRVPLSIEWRGRARPIGYEFLPADLRVDHVYLVSCKYGSRGLFNPSPAHLFDFVLGERPPPTRQGWFEAVAPDSCQAVYVEALRTSGLSRMPSVPSELDASGRRQLQAALPRRWSGDLLQAYRALCDAVSAASAERWRARLPTRREQELMLWRLLRFAMATAPSSSRIRSRRSDDADRTLDARQFASTAPIGG